MLQKYFGTEILLEIPEHLQDVEPEMFPAINTAHELKRLGLIEEIKEIPKFADEPFVHRVTALPARANAGGADFLSREKAFLENLGRNRGKISPAEFRLFLPSDPYKKIIFGNQRMGR